MERVHPARWLTEQAKTGLKELPSNASWLMSRVGDRSDAAGSKASEVATNARRRAERLKGTIADATPLGDDSVESRMNRAREASERARDAEQHALELAQDAREKSAHAKDVGERGRARIEAEEKEGSRTVEGRIAEAELEAAAMIERTREEAREQADRELRETREEVHAEARSAQEDAEKAKEDAEGAMAEATEELAEARRLADEAERAAREKAEQAHEEAEKLAGEARQHAEEADARVTEAKRVGDRTATTTQGAKARAKGSRGGSNGHSSNGGLSSKSKSELLDLAAKIDLEGRSRMSKSQLVSAISGSAGGRATARSSS